MAPIKGQADYSHLSDEELQTKLESYGITVGPINVATRKTYEKRLYKLETGEQSPSAHNYEPVDDDEVQLRFPQAMPASRTPLSSHSEPAYSHMRRDPPEMMSTSRIESRGGLNVARERKPVPRPTTGSKPSPERTASSESRGIPVWVKLVAVLAVVVLVYLIYSNMEQNVGSSIPGGPRRLEV